MEESASVFVRICGKEYFSQTTYLPFSSAALILLVVTRGKRDAGEA